MKSLFLSQLYTETPLTVVGLLLFFTAFVALVGWVYFRTGAREQYEAIARQPLGDSHEPR